MIKTYAQNETHEDTIPVVTTVYKTTIIPIITALDAAFLLGLLPLSSLMSSATQPMSLAEINARLRAMVAQDAAAASQLPPPSLLDRPTPLLGSTTPKSVPPHP